MKVIIKYGYQTRYNIDMEEYQPSTINDYGRISDFFCRALKKKQKKLNNTIIWINNRCAETAEQTIVAPVDGTIIAISSLQETTVLPVKNRYYNLSELLYNTKIAIKQVERYYNGTCFTFYLAPYNYHRVHHPLSGRIVQTTFHRGSLLPVTPFVAQNIKNLYSKNQRFVIDYNISNNIHFTMVLVGALNVGKIELSFDPLFFHRKYTTKTSMRHDYKRLLAQKGNEAAIFQLGSTVLLLFPAGSIVLSSHLQSYLNIDPFLNTPIKMGNALGKIL